MSAWQDAKAEPLLNDEDKEHDPVAEAENKEHCLGHLFHWSEFFFMFGTLTSVSMLIVTQMVWFPYQPYICGGLSVLFALVGAMLIWNLATTKRIAAATEMLREDVNRLKNANVKAKGLQQEAKRQDADMKDKLANMKQASMLLGASANNLEEVQKEEEKMVKERMEMLDKRRELSGKMQADMRRCVTTSLESAREELSERAMLYYGETGQEDDEGMMVGSTEWNTLKQLLADNKIPLDDSVAGDDGILQIDEFITHIDKTLDEHFTKLKEAAMEVHELQMQVLENEIKAIK